MVNRLVTKTLWFLRRSASRLNTRAFTMNPEDVVAPDITFRPVSAFPELHAEPEKTRLHDLTKANTVSKEPRIPTVIHMYDSC